MRIEVKITHYLKKIYKIISNRFEINKVSPYRKIVIFNNTFKYKQGTKKLKIKRK